MPSGSLWLEEPLSQYPPLEGRIKTEVCVVGGGITGLTTAYLLSKAGVKTVVLEAGSLGQGASGHTIAKVTFQHGLIYHRLCVLWGREAALAYAQVNSEAIEQIERVITELGADCGFVRQPAFLYTTLEANVEKLEKEAVIAQSIGIPAKMLHQSNLPLPIKGSLCFEDQAMLHPVRYLKALANGIIRQGGQIYCDSRVKRVENRQAETARGRVEADYIVLATHYPLVHFRGGYYVRLSQSCSNIIAAEGVKIKGMHTGIEPDGLSFRMQGDTLLISGENYRTGTEPKKNHYLPLEDFARSIYARPAGWRWAVQDYLSPDGLPYSGRHSTSLPNLLLATGFSKWGMTQSMAAARLLTDQILGYPNEYAEIFSPARRVGPSVGQMVTNSAGLVRHLIGGYLTRPLAPVCPHMGCKLQYNREENRWECPCHGFHYGKARPLS